VSPRTYKQQTREIEIWATKQKEDVKKKMTKQKAIEIEREKTE